MTSDLKNLLRASAEGAPAEPHSVSEIVRAAQRDHRRHTGFTVGGAALALALVVGVGYAALGGDRSDDAQPVVRQDENVVLTLNASGELTADRSAQEGKDYDVIAEVDGPSLAAVDGWWPDDLTLFSEENSLAVMSADGSTTELDVPEGYLFPALGDGHAVWIGGANHSLLVENMATGERHELSLQLAGRDDLVVDEATGFAVDSGRIWASLPVKGKPRQPDQFVVVSAPLDGSAGFRQEIGDPVAQAVVADGKLVWSPGFGDSLMVRDLASGEESTVAPAPSDECVLMVVAVSAQRVVSEEQCTGAAQVEPGDSTPPGQSGIGDTTVWSLESDSKLVMKGFQAVRSGLSEDAVLVQRGGRDGNTWQTFVYRFDTGELLDLGTAERGFDGGAMNWPTRAAGDRLIVPSPEDDGKMALIELK